MIHIELHQTACVFLEFPIAVSMELQDVMPTFLLET
tara:strand:- start:297 stop:404 length:108 start_codon:yes stop_codon:yes gene_type:complete